MQDDYAFLIEIREKLKLSRDNRDPTQLDYAMKMIEDWISELAPPNP